MNKLADKRARRGSAGGSGGEEVTKKNEAKPLHIRNNNSYASYSALNLHSPVLLLEHRRERCAGGLALEHLLRVWAVRVLEKGGPVFGEELASRSECLKSEFVLYER